MQIQAAHNLLHGATKKNNQYKDGLITEAA